MITLFEVNSDYILGTINYRDRDGNSTGELDLALDIKEISHRFPRGKGRIVYLTEQEYQKYKELQRMLKIA